MESERLLWSCSSLYQTAGFPRVHVSIAYCSREKPTYSNHSFFVHRSSSPPGSRTATRFDCKKAIADGNLDVLTRARGSGHPFFNVMNKCSCRSAALNGHLEVLQWLKRDGCPWDEEACSSAAGNGHLEVRQWLRRNGCQWNETAFYSAAGNGHFEVIQLLRVNGCPWDEKAYAIMQPKRDILKCCSG